MTQSHLRSDRELSFTVLMQLCSTANPHHLWTSDHSAITRPLKRRHVQAGIELSLLEIQVLERVLQQWQNLTASSRVETGVLRLPEIPIYFSQLTSSPVDASLLVGIEALLKRSIEWFDHKGRLHGGKLYTGLKLDEDHFILRLNEYLVHLYTELANLLPHSPV